MRGGATRPPDGSSSASSGAAAKTPPRIAREMAPHRRQSANPANPCSGRSGPTNTASASTSSPSIAERPSSATSILSATLSPASSVRAPALVRQARRDLVEDPVHEGPAALRPVLLPELDGLVDDHLHRHVRLEQLVDRHAQHVPVHLRHAVEPPVRGDALDGLVDGAAVGGDAAHERL